MKLSRNQGTPTLPLPLFFALCLVGLGLSGCLTTRESPDMALPMVDGGLDVITADAPVLPDDGVVDGGTPPPDVGVDRAPLPELPLSQALTPYVLPDDGPGFLLDAIASAQGDLKVVMYLFTETQMRQALVDALQRGVRVRLLIDDSTMTREENRQTVSALMAAGAEIRTGRKTFTFTHEKAIIVDDATVYIMTCNFTNAAFESNREYAVKDDEPDDVAAAIAAFEADWARMDTMLGDARPVVAPDNARDRLRRFLGSATTTLDLELESLGDAALVSLIVDRHQAGVTVRLLIDERGINNDVMRLIANGAEVRTIPGVTVHSKMAIVDGGRAYVGSINLTANSIDRNRELGVLTDNGNAVGRFRQAFESGWSGAQPVTK